MPFFSKKEQIAIILLVVIIVAISLFNFLNKNIFIDRETSHEDNVNELINELSEEDEVNENDEPEEIMVHISGQVYKPGIVKLKVGDRVIDAVNLAGGLKKDADLDKINLAKKLSDEEKNLELTSYLEVTLRTFEGDVVHPAFSNLFISTDYNEELKALIGNRRKRSENEKTHYIIHTIEAEEDIDELTYETSRLNFIGRNKSYQYILFNKLSTSNINKGYIIHI